MSATYVQLASRDHIDDIEILSMDGGSGGQDVIDQWRETPKEYRFLLTVLEGKQSKSVFLSSRFQIIEALNTLPSPIEIESIGDEAIEAAEFISAYGRRQYQ